MGTRADKLTAPCTITLYGEEYAVTAVRKKKGEHNVRLTAVSSTLVSTILVVKTYQIIEERAE